MPKTGGGWRRSSLADPNDWKIDLEFDENQKASMYAEMTMQPSPSIGKRMKCKMGNHGDTGRLIRKRMKGKDGRTRDMRSFIVNYFCVSCGKEFTKDYTTNPKRRDEEYVKHGASSW